MYTRCVCSNIFARISILDILLIFINNIYLFKCAILFIYLKYAMLFIYLKYGILSFYDIRHYADKDD